MVVYTYTVGQDTPTQTIQEAINRIASDLSGSITVEDDITITLLDGVYAGFSIPNGSLFPLLSSGYRLIIKSGGDYFPIIDYNSSGFEAPGAGVDIGAGNPNVTIDHIRIQYFPVGIRASLNSHFLIVKNCIISNNRNVGIFIDQCDQVQVIQNIVINGDYGVVIRLAKDAAVIHNTIFQNGAIATEKGKSIACLWCSLSLDYGSGLSDTGKLYVIGNILWSITGSAMMLFHDDIERTSAIYSNFNDIISGSASYIQIQDRNFTNEATVRRTLSNLRQWKDLGFDAESINEDPRFISPVRIRSNRNGYALDLNLLPVSPVLGKVPSFFVNAVATAAWLPSYVDSSDLAKDILRNPRVQAGTAIGANDKAASSGFYGQDIFTNPLDINITKNCEVDPLMDVISNKLDIWFPKLKPGFFYSNEREFYLYAKKGCNTIGELAVTRFRLPSKVVLTKDITVRVVGKEIDVSKYIDIVGDDLYLYHKDLLIYNYSEEIDIQYWTSQWKDGGFFYQEATVIFKIQDGETKFYLPDTYFPRGPVVLTDDKAYVTNSDYITNREFRLQFDQLEQKSEIVYSENTNQILNSQFDYTVDEAPLLWNSSNAIVKQGVAPLFSIAGSNCCELYPSGYVEHIVPFQTGGCTLSLFASTLGSGQIRFQAQCYDNYLNDLGFIVTGYINPMVSGWKRHYIVFGTSGDNYTSYISDKPYVTESAGYFFIPEETFKLDIKLEHIPNYTNTGSLLIDAVQFENGIRPTQYHRKPFLNEITVEYESSDSSHYIDTHQCMSPVINYQSDGFLYIPEIPAKIYNGPSSDTVTTLHEWRWPEGRRNIIPWARTKGKDKLFFRAGNLFSLERSKKSELVAPVCIVDEIEDASIVPSIPTVVQGDTNGVGFTIIVTDKANNPAALSKCEISIVDPKLGFPGWLFKTAFGLKEQLGQTIFSNLDNAGLLNLTWIPPSEDQSILYTSIPKPSARAGTGDRISFIATKYPINLDNNGNVIILDINNNILPIKSNTLISGTYSCAFAENTSRVVLEYPIVPGSLTVKDALGNVLKEVPVSNPESDQFYADYENSILILKGRHNPIQVEYRPSYVLVNKSNPYNIIMYHDKVFGNMTVGSAITVGYDFTIQLSVVIEQTNSASSKSQIFALVAQNTLLNNKASINPIALEL